MAAEVLSGTGNIAYTNNTGQNVRVIINYLTCGGTISMSWAGVSVSSEQSNATTVGRNLAYSFSTGSTATIDSNNAKIGITGLVLPTEIMLSAGQTFAVVAANPSVPVGAYNIVVIPEAG